jgi:hypothetical protein
MNDFGGDTMHVTTKRLKALALGTLLALATGAAALAQSQDPLEGLDPLLKILVGNKVITLEQARSVQAEYNIQKAEQRSVTQQEVQQQVTAVKSDVQQQVAAEVKKAPAAVPDALKGLKVGSTIFYSFQNYNLSSGVKDETASYSRFILKRGYIDVQKEITPWLYARITPDVYADAAGQTNVRMKYAYAYFHWKGNDFFNQPYLAAGMVQTPWIEMEEAYNRYRMVEPTFLDRNGIWGSADLGVKGGSNLGPLLNEDYRKTVQDQFAGRYGSWSLGFYNGGGYTASEKNQNKAYEWRLSIRPFGEHVKGLEGLQIQWSGVRGLGNQPQNNTVTPPREAPAYNINLYALTYESKYVNASYTYYQGEGNAAGTLLDTTSHDAVLPAAPAKGYSYFVEGKFPGNRRFSGFFRYDHFDTNTNIGLVNKKDNQNMTDVGFAWWFLKTSALVLDYQIIDHTKPWNGQSSGHNAALPSDHRWQLTYQLKF